MIRPGISRRTSAGRPWGRSSKSLPGISCSEEDVTGGGAVTSTGARVASGAGGAVGWAAAGATHRSAARRPREAARGVSIEWFVISRSGRSGKDEHGEGEAAAAGDPVHGVAPGEPDGYPRPAPGRAALCEPQRVGARPPAGGGGEGGVGGAGR